MAEMHECPCGCGEMIVRRKLACRAGWYRLPAAMRGAIQESYRAKEWQAHRHAVVDALQWFRANPAPSAQR